MADLLPTDVLLVNRAGVDYSVPQSDVMANVLDTDLLLVNRAGVDYSASYADVKKGFGPEKIKPAPVDWTTGAAVTGGTGTQVDPFIIAAGTASPAGATIQSGDIGTLTGLKANDLIEWTVNAGGDRFKQGLGVVPAGGTVAFDLTYADTPASTTGQVYNGQLQIGTTFFKWDVTQITGAIDKPAITAPADGAGETIQAVSDEITAYDSGTKTLTFSGSKDLTKFKALDSVKQDSGHTPTSSAVTNVFPAPADVYTITATGLSGTIRGYPGGADPNSLAVVDSSINGTPAMLNWINTQFKTMPFYNSGINDPKKVGNSGLQISKGGQTASITFSYTNGLGKSFRVVYGSSSGSGDGTSVVQYGTISGDATGTFSALSPATGKTTLPKYLSTITFTKASGTFAITNSATDQSAFWQFIELQPETVLTLTDDTDLENFRVGDVVQTGVSISAIDKAKPSITVTGGTWKNGDVVTGPATTPATGTVASIDAVAKTMALSVSDEASPKRWIVNHGKFVEGAPTLSADAAPDVTLITFVSSAYATTPIGAASTMPHFSTDWEVYAKADTAHATLVFGATTDKANLTSWPGAQNQLTADTAYRARIRYHAASADSPWSDDITFKTKA